MQRGARLKSFIRIQMPRKQVLKYLMSNFRMECSGLKSDKARPKGIVRKLGKPVR